MCKTYHLNHKPFQEILLSEEIAKIFDALGRSSARLVGGCVRDILLGKKITDIDIATPLKPDEVISALNSKNIKNIPTGIAHGTITAVINAKTFEITTLREDINCDGRYAEIKYTDSWEEDARRRDFTVNAMSCDIEGVIYDYFSGMDDLKANKIQFVGNEADRIKEDYLRILRYFRFCAFYGDDQFDFKAIKYCAEYATNIKILSKERITSEMMKLISADNPYHSLKQMEICGVLKVIFPNVDIDLEILSRLIEIEKYLKISPYVSLRILALLFHVAKENFNDLSYGFRLTKALSRKISLILYDIGIIKFDEKHIKNAIISNGKEAVIARLIIEQAANPRLDISRLEYLYKMVIDWDVPVFPLTGEDLIKINISAGKQIGILLGKARIYWGKHNYMPDKRNLIDYIIKGSK